jgi:RND family efflux transporter MFP subunit
MRSVIVGVLIIGCGLAALGGCSHGSAHSEEPAESSEPKPVSVSVAAVAARPVQRRIPVVGTLTGLEQIEISPKVAGRVVRIHADLGDRVNTGDPLLEIDPTDYELAVDEAQRNLERELAKIGLTEVPDASFDSESLPSIVRATLLVENARNQFARVRSLIEKRAAAVQEYEQVETNLRVEEATLRQARLEVQATLAAIRYAQTVLETARRNLAETKIVAPECPLGAQAPSSQPTSFVVARRIVSAGEMVSPSTSELLELVIDDALKLKATVPERFAGEVRGGQTIEVQVDAYPDEVFEATITRISPVVDPQSRTFEIEALVPNSEHRLQHGAFAKGAILTRIESEAITAPLESVVTFAGVTKVFAVVDGQAQGTPVELGVRGPGWVELRGSNLKPESVVVTSGQSQLADGTPVEIRAPSEERTASR